MRRLSTVALALGCWWLADVSAQDAEPQPPESPDLDFLEYLGSWAENDGEWLALEELRERNGVDAGGRSEDAEKENGDEDEDE
jgi:hypothetical protein